MPRSKATSLALSTLLLAALAAAPTFAAEAADAEGEAPTYYKDVAPILQANCQNCHRPSGLNLGGMIAPMALGTFQEVRPWARSIARVISSGEMPPWHATDEFNGIFANERTMAGEDVETLLRWVSTGAEPGDEADAPARIEWPSTEWSIGEPDLVLSLAEPYLVEDDLLDRNIFLPAEPVPVGVLDEDRYIIAAEYKPDSTAVHHIIGFARPPGSDDGFGGIIRLPGIAPGAEASLFPEGYGIKLPQGSQILLQMHYNKEPGPGTAVYDQSSVAFRFADEPVQEMYVSSIGDPRKMYVPANTKDVFLTKEETLANDITIMSLLPHMHYRGDYARYTVTLPDGTVSKLLEVPDYDFNWQTRYRYRDHLKLPAGTRMEVRMGYDNTADNANNPDPTVDVGWGDRTNDEMNLGFFYWAYTNESDGEGKSGMRVTPFVPAAAAGGD